MVCPRDPCKRLATYLPWASILLVDYLHYLLFYFQCIWDTKAILIRNEGVNTQLLRKFSQTNKNTIFSNSETFAALISADIEVSIKSTSFPNFKCNVQKKWNHNIASRIKKIFTIQKLHLGLILLFSLRCPHVYLLPFVYLFRFIIYNLLNGMR